MIHDEDSFPDESQFDPNWKSIGFGYAAELIEVRKRIERLEMAVLELNPGLNWKPGDVL